MRRRSSPRRGFTLLEVLLAALIAILLLGALYFAMDVTLRQTQEGRDSVEVDNASRGVFHRMNMDLSAVLAPLPPKSGGNAATGTTGGSGGSSSTTSSTGVVGSSSTSSTAPSGSTATSSATTAAASTTSATTDGSSGGTSTQPQADIGFQAGVIGTDTQLVIFVSRLPNALADTGVLLQPADTTVQTPSDQYRVAYWKGENGQLCRQERAWVTADGIRDSYDPDRGNEAADTLADEVTDVTFEYFDGSSWASSWDGTTPGPDGVTPQGPPRAVRVTLTISIPSSRPGSPPATQKAIQVIPIRAAPGLYTPPLIMPDTDSGAISSGSGSTGGGGSGNSASATSGNSSNGPSAGGTGAGAPMSSSGGGSSGAPKSSSAGSTPAPAASGGAAGSGSGAKSGGSTGANSGSKAGSGK